ncbi:NAD(P)H-dependent glycerol-3-phosphate dehydrogenase [Paracoccus sp. (in: a-proteobacteria)]|uniref:NAD(P)H-dependent glycerol-3-phosphate dehydrogenase n=1 Tax=Paracoccus sp. TaxID=267 RepID=UPI0026DFCC6B|nr:NAD(P)H-dependent glycerol-3-phosphate dehydrogenase [Paracoccus sp. (in: a-proteobacteria)]MDO5370603.1 NAD(P)H-dependent glycerol-3-phosphate dehydrogenase [Paracoccus sp. (in: a-proteobacteria)]
MSVAVLGAGAFGTALAVALSANGPVTLWGRRIGWQGENPLLPGVTLSEGVTVTETLPDADILLVAIPAQATGAFLSDHAARLDGRALVSCAKGIDLATGRSPARMLAEACPKATVAVLTGPSFAADIARGLPTALTLACADSGAGHGLQHALSTPVLRLYRTTDVTGAELGGALKNVIAIAAGVAIGAGLGDSARAAIVTRGFAEMTRFAAAKGGDPETLTGLSGLGDLILTATSEQSRNFRYGLSLGRAETFDPHVTVEGAATARAVATIAARDGIEMPVSALIAGLAGGRVGVKQAVELLLARPLKEE